MARAAFLGTPALAVPFLHVLASNHDVVGVVTRPDAPRGRSRRPVPSPVAEAAAGLAIEKPAGSAELAPALRSFGELDVAVVVAYGALIRPEALAIPSRGFLNVHFSVLPRWRGAAPVQRAILAGDARTGVTIMKLDAGLDTGPYLAVTSIATGKDRTAGEVLEQLVDTGVALLSRVLDPYLAGRRLPVSQPPSGTTAPKIASSETRLDIEDDPGGFVARAMAFSPSPGAWVEHGGTKLIVLRARLAEGTGEPGTLYFDGRRVHCDVGRGRVELLEVKPSGGRRMPAADWARGRRDELGRLA